MRRASLAAVLIAVCCVSTPLMRGALGLGALSGQLDRYVPLVIVLGAGAMAGVTYRMYRRRAQQVLADDPTCDCRDQRRAMLLNAMLALLLMAVGFLLV